MVLLHAQLRIFYENLAEKQKNKTKQNKYACTGKILHAESQFYMYMHLSKLSTAGSKQLVGSIPEEEELYLLKTLVVLSMILCSFSVLWNNIAVFQFNISLPHCNGKLV